MGTNGVTTSAAGKTISVTGVNATAGATEFLATRGVASFDSADFTVTNGFVELVGGIGVETFLTDDGAPAVEPDLVGQVKVLGGEGIDVKGQGPGNTITVSGEDATAGPAAIFANKGIASFDSTHFAVAGGFVQATGAVAIQFTAENGTTCVPAIGNLNIVGTATNGINTTAAGSTMTIGMASPYSDGNFTFENNVAATPRVVVIENNDTDPGSYAALAVSTEPAGGDAFIFWEIDSATQYYSLGIDNSVAGDPFKLTNNVNPSTGNDLISITNVGVITLFNDLDVTEGGTGVSTLTSHGILMGNGAGDIQATAEPSDGQLLIGDTGGFPILSTLTAGTGISIANAAGSITINGTGGGLTWSVKTLATGMAVNNGYGSNAVGAVAFTLPVASAVGDTIAIQGMQGSWNVVQGAGQQIYIGSAASTLGAGGSISSTNAFDAITLVCLVANTFWFANSLQGNITVV